MRKEDYQPDGTPKNEETPIVETRETVVFNAGTALRISQQNAITIDNVIQAIQNQAKNGHRSMNFIGVDFSDLLINKVLNLDFQISRSTNPWGEQVTKISW